MTRPIYGSRLIVTAEKLAGVGAGSGRPASSDLRRATSTAYYALFHQVVRHGAFAYLVDGSEDEIAEIARWFTHTGILDASRLVLEADSVKPLQQMKRGDRAAVMSIRSAAGLGGVTWTPGDRLPSQVVVVADAFQTLQEARHSADYDGNYDPVRAVTINHVADADAAIRATWSLWRSDGSPRKNRQHWWPAYRAFLLLALLKSGGPRAR